MPVERGDFIPVEEVLPGVELVQLPPGFTPLEAAVLVKVLDADGDVTWAIRWTKGLGKVEMLGAFTMASADTSRDLVVSLNGDGEAD